ncbi:hypothetical protein AB9K34_08615 [Sedimentitalea sp. XS_ASV28]|uniref:hypothetical protein n=1 Tax=Sedimentitalea sp. XS_ASV28 TaxID=3241296 RepID=UPI0035122058
MADRALTREAMLNGLHDIRLPAEAAGGLAAELLATIGLALAIALLIGIALRAMSRPRQARPEPGAAERLAALRDLPPSERQIALLHLLKAERPDAFRHLSDRLYAPGGLPDVETLETEVRAT